MLQITQDEFCGLLLTAIHNETPAEDIVLLKNEEALLLHDLQLDAGLFEYIMLDVIGLIKETKGTHPPVIQIKSVMPFLPNKIGLFDRFFSRVEKKYYPKFKPISVKEAAALMYRDSF
ncbi:hypothetical protein GCM10007853_20990 [Algimonas ampicilliniresistens]|uniref:Uncharacterized protein n=1 Tax=Algimonas ampicilliniresistens TaxID=1298735 RepID=A0ABQ5V9V4_9PROT|nr:hypothetical protein [Algimonas ampicilliniresistens]GLQ24225.1 hypothetical protein GCM10007853_20990 [Algimonas ampicilliniresistens]